MKLKNHTGFTLRDDAAASFNRVEDVNGLFTVTSAKRTVAEQQTFIDRWNQGGTFNRPPYLYHPATPPETSAHVANGGRAVDILEYEKFSRVAEDHGFIRTFEWDVVHFEYFPEKDKFFHTVDLTGKSYNMEFYILREDGTVFHITPVKAYAFTSVDDYNSWRSIVTASGVKTSMVKPPAITSLKPWPAWRVQAIADRLGVSLTQ